MSGLRLCAGAVVVAAAALPAGLFGAAPVVPVVGPSSVQAANQIATVAPGADALSGPIPNQTATTTIPLPPGVFVGLTGLASAAIARRRYLRRH